MARSISAIRGMTVRLHVSLLNLGKQSLKSILGTNILKFTLIFTENGKSPLDRSMKKPHFSAVLLKESLPLGCNGEENGGAYFRI